MAQTSKLNPALLAAHGIPAPTAEYKFSPVRRWRWDFAWLNEKVAVEIDGGMWIGGAHARGARRRSDNEKQNAGIELGWVCLRYYPKEVDYEQIARILVRRHSPLDVA